MSFNADDELPCVISEFEANLYIAQSIFADLFTLFIAKNPHCLVNKRTE
jgi:hypothetical protein